MKFPVEVGQVTKFTKTITEHDVYQFAGITGDFSPNHVNKSYIEKTIFGRQMAHGALLVGFIASASTLAVTDVDNFNETPVSLGYDRIRYVKPVFFGDTITVEYEITEIDEEKQRSIANVRITNQQGELNAVAIHVVKWVSN